jgi:hypothetical protein
VLCPTALPPMFGPSPPDSPDLEGAAWADPGRLTGAAAAIEMSQMMAYIDATVGGDVEEPMMAAMTSPTCSLTDVSQPYGQRMRQLISELNYLEMTPACYRACYMSDIRDDYDWGQDTTTREWPSGSTVLLSRKNAFYTGPPPDGIKVRQSALDIDVHRVAIVESKFIPEFHMSRWISVSFHFKGKTIWTNVVREPLLLRTYLRPNLPSYNHTQWGYRFPFPPESLASGASLCQPMGHGRKRKRAEEMGPRGDGLTYQLRH